MEGEQGSAPAGWYPDPLGLPQLRWWDGAQWSEFTSEPAVPAASEPEAASVGDTAVPGDAEPVFVDPLADFLNGNIARTGSTGVNPVLLADPLHPGASAAEPTPAPAVDAAPLAPEPAVILDHPSAPGVPLSTMEIPQLIGYDDEGHEFIEPILPIVTTPGIAPVPPGGAPVPSSAPIPPVPTDPSQGPAQPAELIDEALQPSFPPQPAVPEQLLVAPQAADPFAATTSTVDADPESGETFGSRRARREYRRQQEIEGGPLDATSAPLDPGAMAGPEPLGVPVVSPAGVPSALRPRVGFSGFSIESTEIAEDYPPDRRLLDKPTYSGAAYLLALLGVLAVAAIALLVVVLGLGNDHGLVWGVWGAAWLTGILLAFYDRLKLKSWGHANTASPLLAIFTPILYLVARNTATKGETGHGSKVLVYWIVGLLISVAIVFLVPQVMEATIPGFEATWQSPLAH